MSTNYYLRRKPTVEKVEELKKMIDTTLTGVGYKDVLDTVQEMYGANDSYNHDNGVIHIGKRSGGWQFLWCTNVYKKNIGYMDFDTHTWVDKYKIVKTYELTKQGLTDFIMRDEFVVVDEYDEIQDKGEFLYMAFHWDPEGWDSISYRKEYPLGYVWDESKNQEIFKELGYEFENESQSDFHSDGLRFSISDEFS